MYKNKISGVYSITNNVTGELYIGSSKNIKSRWANHKCLSQWKLYPGMKLYQAFIKYGLDNFIFEIIEETGNLREREQYWIEQLKPSYNNNWAYGRDIKRYRENNIKSTKEWRKNHREEQLKKMKAYNHAHRDGLLVKNKSYYNRLCLYEGDTLTLNALSARFIRQGIPHARLEAKKYLIEKEE